MRIAVVNRTGGGISGGYRRYLQKMLPGFCAHPGVEAVLCAAPDTMRCSEWVPAHGKLRFASCPRFLPFGSGLSADFKAELDGFRPDVIFVPVERYFRYGEVPVVSMIQNMAPLRPNGNYRLAERLRMLVQRWTARRAILASSHVIAMSEFVREFLLHDWHVRPERITRVYFGAPDCCADKERPAALPAGWQGDYFFSAGSLEPYRGLEDLIAAAGRLKRSGRPVKMAVAGTGRPVVAYYKSALQSMARAEGVEGDIAWLGQLGPAEMNWCYHDCAAFVMTSRVEALAVIILEAMANNCLCVSADNPPFPEAFGESALFYRSGDPAALAARLTEALDGGMALRAALAGKASAALGRFSWGKAVEDTLLVLARTAGVPL